MRGASAPYIFSSAVTILGSVIPSRRSAARDPRPTERRSLHGTGSLAVFAARDDTGANGGIISGHGSCRDEVPTTERLRHPRPGRVVRADGPPAGNTAGDHLP